MYPGGALPANDRVERHCGACGIHRLCFPRSGAFSRLDAPSCPATERVGRAPSVLLLRSIDMRQAETSAPCCEYVVWETQSPSASDADASTPCVAELQRTASTKPPVASATEPKLRSVCGGLEVRASVIPAAGLGLFAGRRYEQGELLPCECAQGLRQSASPVHSAAVRVQICAAASQSRELIETWRIHAFADTGDRLTFAQVHRLPDSERDYVMGLHFNTCA